jgi:hypothetical protein
MILFATGTAYAEPSTPFPSNDILSALTENATPRAGELADDLRSGQASARECSFESGSYQCTCLERTVGDVRITARVVRADGIAEGLWIEAGPERFFVGELVRSDEGLVLQDVAWSDDGVVLRAAGGWIRDGALLERLRWYRETLPESGCDAQPSAPVTRPYARANSAERVDGHWRAAGLRIGPWPIGDVPMQRPVSGVLPPTLRVSAAGGELQGDYWLAPWGSVLAVADPSGRFGGGFGLTSRRREHFRRLDLVAYADVDEGLVGVASGDVSLGERLHLRGHVEHPSDEYASRLRAFERNALFRRWRHSRLGLSLSGAGHALQLRGAVLTDPELPDAHWDGNLTYGLTFARQRHSVFRFDLDHRTIERSDTVHSTLAALSWRAPFGHESRAWVKPGIDLVANYGTVTALRGFDASTTISSLANLEAGLAIEGRFARFRHRLAPQVRAGGEVLGVQQRQPEEGAPPYPWRQPDRWRWVAASLDQRIQQSGWRLDFPVGVFSDTLGDEPVSDLAADPNGFARVDARFADVSAGVASTCTFPCDTPRFHAAAQIAPTRRVRAWYAAGNMNTRDLHLAWADLHLDQPLTAVRLVQTRDAGDDAPVFGHHAGLQLRSGRASLRLMGTWGNTDESRGLGSRVAYSWRELGWGIGVGGGWRPFDGVWNATAGLTWAPPE